MRRFSAGMGAVCLVACAGAAAPAHAPRPEAYHGVVVWLEGGEAVQVAFTPGWIVGDLQAEFLPTPAGGGWRAQGRLRGDSLYLHVSRRTGDVGIGVHLAGLAEGDGRVSGCSRRTRGRLPNPRAAFALAPAHLPASTAADAPVERCTHSNESAGSQ